MASYQSIPAQMPQIQQPLDVDFMGKVLMAKEQQTNLNIAQIDETLGQLKIQENMLIGDQRKARFANNVQTLLDEVSRSGKLNLQSGDFTRRMKNYVTTALDDYTLEHISKANNIRAFQADVAEKKKKGDGSYNDANYGYAAWKGGLQGYVNEDTDELGNLSYTPYINYKETSMKKALELKQLKGEQVIEVPDLYHPGRMIKTTINGLTPEEVVNYFPDILDENEKKQMVIDGWSQLQGAPPEIIKQQADSFFTGVRAKLSKNISLEDAIINSPTSSKEQKDEANRLKANYTAQLKDYTEKETQIDKTNPEQVGYLLNKQSYMNMAQNLFTGRKSVSYEKDEVYYADENLLLAKNEFQLKIAKEQRDVLEFEAKMQKEYGLNPDGTKADSQKWQPTPEQNQNTPEPDELYTSTKESFNEAYNNIVNASQGAYTDELTTDEHRQLFDATLERGNYKMVNGKIVSTIENNPVSKASIAETAFKESGMYNLNNGYEKVISDNSEKRLILSKALVKAEKKLKENITEEYITDSLIESSLSRPNMSFEGAITEEDKIIRDKIDTFIKENGGANALENKMKKDVNTKLKAISILKEVDNINQKANPEYAEKIIKSEDFNNVSDVLEKEGIRPFVKQRMVVNVPTEKEKQIIVNNLPQRLNDKDGNPQPLNSATFDVKAPMTVIPGVDYVDIVQDKGVNEKGVSKTQATHRAFKGSVAYNIVMQNMSIATDFKLDATNVPQSYSIKADIKPKFISKQDEVVLGNFYNRYETNVNPNLKETLSKQIGVDPKIFATKENTKLYIKSIVGDKATDTQVDNLLNRINDNFEKYTIEIAPNNKQNWVVKMNSPKAGEIKKYLSSGSELDSDYMYLVKNMPQILILTQIAKELQQNPEEIDNL